MENLEILYSVHCVGLLDWGAASTPTTNRVWGELC